MICWITTCPEQYFTDETVALLIGAAVFYLVVVVAEVITDRWTRRGPGSE